ncbi:hypothetical protein GQ473_05830, partial [archaeon]|nr:hypothetical protein [archaeon]
ENEINAEEQKLYAIAECLILAAKTGNYKDIVHLNETEFCPAFNRVFPLDSCNNPLAMAYDVVRNECINVVQNAWYGGENINMHLENVSKYFLNIPSP